MRKTPLKYGDIPANLYGRYFGMLYGDEPVGRPRAKDDIEYITQDNSVCPQVIPKNTTAPNPQQKQQESKISVPQSEAKIPPKFVRPVPPAPEAPPPPPPPNINEGWWKTPLVLGTTALATGLVASYYGGLEEKKIDREVIDRSKGMEMEMEEIKRPPKIDPTVGYSVPFDKLPSAPKYPPAEPPAEPEEFVIDDPYIHDILAYLEDRPQPKREKKKKKKHKKRSVVVIEGKEVEDYPRPPPPERKKSKPRKGLFDEPRELPKAFREESDLKKRLDRLSSRAESASEDYLKQREMRRRARAKAKERKEKAGKRAGKDVVGLALKALKESRGKGEMKGSGFRKRPKYIKRR